MTFRTEDIMILAVCLYFVLYMLNKIEVIFDMTGEKKDKPMFFPFMTHHEWYGFEDAQELAHFLEDGILPTRAEFEEEDDVLMLPKPKDRRRRGKKNTEENESNSNGSSKKPIVRVRGNEITEITVPIETKEPKVTEQSVKIGPIIDGETMETIIEDIAYGGEGG